MSPLTGPTESRGQKWSMVSKKKSRRGIGIACVLSIGCQYVERWLEEDNRQSRETNRNRPTSDQASTPGPSRCECDA